VKERISTVAASAHAELMRGFGLTLFHSFQEAEGEWSRLETQCSSYPFQRRLWLKTWQETIGDARSYSPAIGIVRSPDGSASALLRWRYETGGFREAWSGWAGACPIIRDPLSCRNLASTVHSCLSAIRAAARMLRCSLIFLERNPGILGGEPNPLLGPGFKKLHYGSHFAVVPGDIALFLKERFGSKGSYNLRRSEKRLGQLGRLEFLVAENRGRAFRSYCYDGSP